MDFATRDYDALVELNPGESRTWRLPPMTPGAIVVNSYYAMPPGWTSDSGTSARTTPRGGHTGHSTRGQGGVGTTATPGTLGEAERERPHEGADPWRVWGRSARWRWQ